MPRLRFCLCLAIATSLAVGAAANAGAAEAATIEWTTCGDGLECGRLAVPVDYASPNGRQIKLALIRTRATSEEGRIGSLVVNPGGPGGSGVEWLRESRRALSPALLERFDVVGFDPRGVGRSAGVLCLTDAERDAAMKGPVVPRTAAERAEAVAYVKRFVAKCIRRNHGLLPYLTTEATARDLDRLRAALGDEKLTYLGFSYGTVLGSTYASLFPRRVRALALDGADDPRVWTGEAAVHQRAQAVGFERAYLAFLAWCRLQGSQCALADHGDPALTIPRLLAKLRGHPVRVRLAGGPERLLTETHAFTAVISALYSRSYWTLLASITGDRLSGTEGVILLALADRYNERHFDGTYSSLANSFIAISCVDHARASPDPATYVRLSTELAKISPLAGGALGYEHLFCAYWPQPASRYTGPFTAKGAPPILVIGTTGDPATPYEWAKSLAEELDSGVLLTRVGEGHTAYGVSDCIREHVDRYLLTGSPPRNGTVCRS